MHPSRKEPADFTLFKSNSNSHIFFHSPSSASPLDLTRSWVSSCVDWDSFLSILGFTVFGSKTSSFVSLRLSATSSSASNLKSLKGRQVFVLTLSRSHLRQRSQKRRDKDCVFTLSTNTAHSTALPSRTCLKSSMSKAATRSHHAKDLRCMSLRCSQEVSSPEDQPLLLLQY